MLNKVTKRVTDWDKDKRTGLFRKTTTGRALCAGADADGVNCHMGWRPDAADQTVLTSSNAAEGYGVPAPKPSRVAKPPKHPEFFQSQTIAGRYQEWIGGAQYAGIKSQLVMGRNGLVSPRTGHGSPAVDNLRRKRNLPEAIEQLVMQGLSSSVAIALVTKVVNNLG